MSEKRCNSDWTAHRIVKFRRAVQTDTQALRERMFAYLEPLLEQAKDNAKNPMDDTKKRQAWTDVAAHTARVLNSIAKDYDSVRVDEDLKELENLLDETKKAKAARELSQQHSS